MHIDSSFAAIAVAATLGHACQLVLQLLVLTMLLNPIQL